jgi:hypothetical protein
VSCEAPLVRALGSGELVRQFLNALRLEFSLPLQRVDYYYHHGHQGDEGQALILPPLWRDERLLAEAREGFDRRSRGR